MRHKNCTTASMNYKGEQLYSLCLCVCVVTVLETQFVQSYTTGLSDRKNVLLLLLFFFF